MKLSVVIITYNSEEFIEECVDSVIKFLPNDSEVVAFDNASEDRTVEILKKFVPKIKLFESDKNLGFGKGNNRASEMCEGEYLFFLNPDTSLYEYVFEKLVNYYQKTPDAGIVSPKLITPNGEVQKSVIKFPTVSGAFSDLFLGTHGEYFPYAPESHEPVEVDCVFGAAMLISRDLFKKISGFDEKFFMYYEDIDLCRRIIELGLKIIYYPMVEIKHIVGGTKSKNKYRLNLESSIKYNGYFKSIIFQMIFKLHRLLRS